jgi:hypothetical protein
MKTGTDRKYTAEFRDSAGEAGDRGRKTNNGSSEVARDVEQDANELGESGARGLSVGQACACAADFGVGG